MARLVTLQIIGLQVRNIHLETTPNRRFTYVAMYLYIMLVYLYIPLRICIPRLCTSIVDIYIVCCVCM